WRVWVAVGVVENPLTHLLLPFDDLLKQLLKLSLRNVAVGVQVALRFVRRVLCWRGEHWCVAGGSDSTSTHQAQHRGERTKHSNLLARVTSRSSGIPSVGQAQERAGAGRCLPC